MISSQMPKNMDRNLQVTFLRHYESEFNEHESEHSLTLFTTKDCPLSGAGIAHAKHLSSVLPGTIEPDLILCSPLERCIQTLWYTKVTGPVIFTNMCREHKTDVCDFYDHEDATDVESIPELMQRVSDFRAYLNRLGESFKTILVISHADFIWYFTSRVKCGERFGRWLGNGETLTLEEL